jgi:hypothetical protein
MPYAKPPLSLVAKINCLLMFGHAGVAGRHAYLAPQLGSELLAQRGQDAQLSLFDLLIGQCAVR